MYRICSLMLCLLCVSLFLSACKTKTTKPLIQSQRRFAQYVEPQDSKQAGVIDLSEGPRLRYDAELGPKNPEFDFKIINPY